MFIYGEIILKKGGDGEVYDDGNRGTQLELFLCGRCLIGEALLQKVFP